MKKVLIGLLLLLPLSSVASPNRDPSPYQGIRHLMEQVQNEYDALQGVHIRLIVGGPENNDGLNAYSIRKEVYISHEMYKIIQHNFNAGAWLFGHELGHIAHGETMPGTNRDNFCDTIKGSRYCEQQADYSGIAAGNAAGYNACAGARTLLMQLAKIQGYDTPEPTHGSIKQRMDSVNSVCKGK